MFHRLSTNLAKPVVTGPIGGSLRSRLCFLSTDAFKNIPQAKETVLPNGLKVVTEETFHPTATVGLFVNAGSSFETRENNGTAHFLEHLAFKGTGRRTRKQLEVEVENLGASLNAYTSREQTVYLAKSFKDDVPKTVDIISDIVQSSLLSEESIEAERSVILREMKEVESHEEEVIFDHLHSIAFQESSLGYTILGPVENIKSIKRPDILNYIKNHYTADRMVLVGAGGVKHEQLVELAQKSFSNLPKTGTVPTLPPHKFIGSQVVVLDSEKKDVHVAIAFEGCSWSDSDYFTLMVLQSIIGSWDVNSGAGKNVGSNLNEFVAQNSLAKKIAPFTTCYNSTGLFGIYAVTQDAALEDLLVAIFQEWRRLGFSPSEFEVARARNKLKASLLLSLDGTTALTEDIGRQFLTLGRRISPAEVFYRIDQITPKHISEFVDRKIRDRCFAIAALGDVQHIPDYNTMRGWTNSKIL